MSELSVEFAGPRAYLQAPGTAELRWSGATRSRFLATGATTDGAFCVVDETAMQGEEVPLHRHVRDLEAIYVVAGELSVFLNRESGRTAGAGAFTYIPAGAVHGFRVESETARYLLITTPHHGEFYRAISRPSAADGSGPDHPVDEAAIWAACKAYDVDYIGTLPPAGVQEIRDIP